MKPNAPLLRLLLLCLLMFLPGAATLHGRVFHSLVFVNAHGDEDYRRREMADLLDFHKNMARALGYKHNLRSCSAANFTAENMERTITSLNVREGDVVYFDFTGHGCNWDDDQWPHMGLLDSQYWQSRAFSLLCRHAQKAKLIICAANCCNMDSQGRPASADTRSRERLELDSVRARQLFLGFDGRRAIITSSSIAGQYSWATSGGNTRPLGGIYGAELRATLHEYLAAGSSSPLTWPAVLDEAARRTKAVTEGKQQPQYQIFSNPTPGTVDDGTDSSRPPSAKVNSTTLKFTKIGNKTYLEINVSLTVHNLSSQGAQVVALLESPKGTGVPDRNRRYATSAGNVCVTQNIGTHRPSATFSNLRLLIPKSELHLMPGTKTYYVRVGVYDYSTRRYLAFGDYAAFSARPR